MSSVDLTVSRHVREDRWLRRSDDPWVEPHEAWQEGVEIYGHGLDCHEARYHADTETVLLRKNHTIVTVLDAKGSRPSVRRAINHFAGGSI